MGPVTPQVLPRRTPVIEQSILN